MLFRSELYPSVRVAGGNQLGMACHKEIPVAKLKPMDFQIGKPTRDCSKGSFESGLGSFIFAWLGVENEKTR